MKNQKGFTLLETIIYLALFAFVIGGGLLAVFQIIQGSESNDNQTIVFEEGNFLLQKIDWGMEGASSVSVSSATNFLTTKIISGTATTLTFNFSGPDLTLKRDVAPAIILNSSSVSLSHVSFVKIPAVRGQPDGISVRFTLTSASSGRNFSQDFFLVKYLRR